MYFDLYKDIGQEISLMHLFTEFNSKYLSGVTLMGY